MQVGLIIYGSLDTISGGYLYDRVLVEHLQAHGDQVRVFSLPWRGCTRHLADNISNDLYRQLTSSHLDILLQDELNHQSLFWMNRRIKNTTGYPIVSIVHHLRISELRPAWQNLLYGLLERRYLSSVDGFIFNSRTTYTAVIDRIYPTKLPPYIIAAPGGDRLNPAVTDRQIIDRSHQPSPIRLCFVGNLIPRKGLHTLLEALSLVPQGIAQLDIVGDTQIDTAYTREIRSLLARCNLTSRVRLLGSVSDKHLAGIMENAQLLVVPSTFEGFGITYLEGMGFGLPAVGTTRGAAGEIITHNQDGFLIDPGDSRTLAHLVAKLDRERDLLQDISLAARQSYLSHPTWALTTSKIHHFLSGLIQ